MRVTREAVFETNSSSSHSISIHGGGYVCDPCHHDRLTAMARAAAIPGVQASPSHT